MSRLIARLLVALVAPVAIAAGAPDHVVHYEIPDDLRVARSPPTAARTGGATRLEFSAFGQRFDANLYSNVRLLNSLPTTSRANLTGIEVYRGRLQNVAGSWLRVSFVDGELSGVVWDGQTMYALAPAAQLGNKRPATMRATDSVVIRVDDRFTVLRDIAVVAPHPKRMASTAPAKTNKNAATVRQIDIALVADVELSRQSSNPAGEMIAALNVADGIFVDQAGVHLNLSSLDVFDTEPDPFSATDPGDLLDELATHKFDTPALRNAGLAHLLTGKNLDGNVGGLAYIDVLCAPRSGAGVTQHLAGNITGLVMAHEFGHNFAAPHDGEDGSPCETTPSGALMSAGLTRSSRFSQCSLDHMAPAIAAATCLSDIPPTDLGITVTPEAMTWFGAPTTITISVQNSGDGLATDVAFAADFGTGLDVLQTSTFSGQCVTQRHAIDCQVDLLRPGESASVRVTLQPVIIGQSTGQASVTTAGDPNSANDTVAFEVVVRPASDVSASVNPQQADLKPGDSAQFTATFTNHGPVATAVAAVIELANGDVIGTLPTAIPCTTEATDVRCDLGTLDVDESIDLLVQIRAFSTPPVAPVEVDVSSVFIRAEPTEFDFDTADNVATATLNVWRTFVDLVPLFVDVPVTLSAQTATPFVVALENVGGDIATEGSIDIRVPGGVQLGNGSADRGNCTARSPQWVSCTATNLGPLEKMTVTLDVTGTTPATRSLNLSTQASGFDTDTTNDTLTRAFTVNPTPPQPPPVPPPGNGGGGGGGGALGVVSLFVTGVWLRRRQQARL